MILKSNLDNIAGSRKSFLLVAQINITSLSLSNESNFLNKIDTNLFETSWVSFSFLETANASISSINIILLPKADAFSNIVDKFYSALPYHLLKTASIGTYIKGIPTYEAIIFAEVVLPVPGGPSNRIAFGLLRSHFYLVFLVISS